MATAGTACGNAPDSVAPAGASTTADDGDWLVFGDTAEPSTLNCARVTERSAVQVCRLVCDSLIDFDADFHFVPRLARSWEFSPDGLKLTFHLRRGVTWHDGAPFSAADVLYTLDLALRIDPSGERYRLYYGPVTSVAAPDDHTVTIAYAEPFAGALPGFRETLIMPEHLPFDPAGASPLDTAPVGTGPFRFVRWDPQQEIVLEANTGYFGGRPHLDGYIQRIVPSVEALRAAVEREVVDVAGLTTDWVAEHPVPDGRFPFRVVSYPGSSMEMIYWNIDEPRGLFRDARVRRAMTLLLDRRGYVDRIHHGLYRVATTLIDPTLWGGDPGLEPYPFDPNAAARLLDEAGVVDRDGDGVRDTPDGPMSFTLLYASINPNHRELASMLERAAAGVGVQVRIQGLEWSVMRPRIREHRFEAAIYRWSLEPLPDPFAYFHSSRIESGFNFGGYRSAAFDRISEEARHTLDPALAADQLTRLQRILHEDQPCTFVAIPGSVVAIHRRFHTPEITAAGLWNWYPSLSAWWVPAAERKYP